MPKHFAKYFFANFTRQIFVECKNLRETCKIGATGNEGFLILVCLRTVNFEFALEIAFADFFETYVGF